MYHNALCLMQTLTTQQYHLQDQVAQLLFVCFQSNASVVVLQLKNIIQNTTIMIFVSSEVEMNRTWTDNINLFQSLHLFE